jgi:hypothetical protein
MSSMVIKCNLNWYLSNRFDKNYLENAVLRLFFKCLSHLYKYTHSASGKINNKNINIETLIKDMCYIFNYQWRD